MFLCQKFRSEQSHGRHLLTGTDYLMQTRGVACGILRRPTEADFRSRCGESLGRTHFDAVGIRSFQAKDEHVLPVAIQDWERNYSCCMCCGSYCRQRCFHVDTPNHAHAQLLPHPSHGRRFPFPGYAYTLRPCDHHAPCPAPNLAHARWAGPFHVSNMDWLVLAHSGEPYPAVERFAGGRIGPVAL